VEGLKFDITEMNESEGEKMGQLLEKNINMMEELASMTDLLAKKQKMSKAPEEFATR
jgi:hypothetical protein